MLVTLSERKFAEQIRQLEGIDVDIEEIVHRIKAYAGRIFDHLRKAYGMDFQGMTGVDGNLGTALFDISGIGRDWQTGDFNWSKLHGGLNFLSPVSVSIQKQDIPAICTDLVRTAMDDAWYEYEDTLQRLSVAEIQPAIEEAIRNVVWRGGRHFSTEITGDPDRDANLQFERAGLKNPTAEWEKVQEYRQNELDAVKAAEDARLERVRNGGF